MSNTITVRLSEDLAKWLSEVSRETGIPVGRIVRAELKRAKEQQGKQPFLRHAGEIDGPPDLSSRKGYRRK